MDVITDLTAQAVSFLTVVQDVYKKESSIKKLTQTKDGYLWDLVSIDDMQQKCLDCLYWDETNNPQIRINEIIWSSDGDLHPDRSIKCFFHIAADLLLWLKSHTDQYHLRYEKIYGKEIIEDGTLYSTPFHWRRMIRSILYENPTEREILSSVLHYMPLQIILCVGGKKLSLYKQRLFQIWESQPSFELLSGTDKQTNSDWWKNRHDIAKKLLINDSMILDQLMVANNALPFETIFNRELNEINASRLQRSVDAGNKQSFSFPGVPLSAEETQDPFLRAKQMKLTGLAFSGGGIRSATFNLGVLQHLAERDVLSRVDYLSTVSGGGYIGAWFTSWIKRAGSVSKVTQRLNSKKSADPMADEVQPIRWLRMYSNYLAPEASIMSADAWTMGVTWLRNTIINQIILLLLLCTGLSLVTCFFKGWQYFTQRLDIITPLYIGIWSFIILVPGAIFAGLGMRSYDRTHPPQAFFNLGTHKFLAVFLVGWAVVASYVISSWLYHMPDDINTIAAVARVLWPTALVGSVFVITVAIVGNYHKCAQSDMQKKLIYPAIIISSIIAAVAGIYMIGAVWSLFQFLKDKIHFSNTLLSIFGNMHERLPYRIVFIIGVPLIMEVMVFCVIIRMVLMGSLFPDERREWWGRMGAITHRFILLWLLATISALILYRLLHGLYTNPKVFTSVVGGWGAIIATAVKMAYDSTSSGENKKKNGWTIKEIFIRLAPYLFMIGFLFIGAALLQLFNHIINAYIDDNLVMHRASVYQTIIHDPVQHIATVHQKVVHKIYFNFVSEMLTCLSVTFLIGGLTLFLSWRIGVNEFSLHHFYRNRLVRAYLGATRRRVDRNKTANSFTGFDKADDIKLSEFLVEKEYYGPYPILNTALNATSVTELDRQDRKAEAFMFSPLFCGFDFSPTRSTANNKNHVYEYGYRPTLNFAYERGPNIGTAMAISGAAVSPNMGYHSSSATAFLLTMFNVRLGWWIGNPRLNQWKRSDPGTGIAYIVKDLIGKSDIDSAYVCLSDGGHFDNMGLYELIRRRCTYIILGDAEEDATAVCEGLANAIRRCRIDFGVEIVIDTTPITKKDKDTGFSIERAITTGTIAYPGETEPSGKLVYIKTTLTDNLSTDIREYQMQNTEFPQQSTGDQFFDESQFESYRKLGYHALDGINLDLPF